ncbi:hypothetical protein QTQ03_07820 [Micromonospora sp. WMMA1363]|uniref:hypothetical protein n=1 Tax=Micromonospora sp. WMMA1363 TaxID=3053985 RepID=UPI00259CAA90|nr:hypothetical protein [Micromonospora sp. WMMA1363]MDM4719508.1 hypothetical protein [Micromonospora sp. WMMA1363]
MVRAAGQRRLGAALVAVAAALAPPTPAVAATGSGHAATQAALDDFQAVGGPGAGLYAGDRTSSWSLHAGTSATGTGQAIQPTDHYRVGSPARRWARRSRTGSSNRLV